MDVNGENDEMVVPYKSMISFSDGSREFRMNNPVLNWSSDSSKIVYHKCMLARDNCHDINEYGIFIYDLKTDSEELIIEGGMNPSWNYYK